MMTPEDRAKLEEEIASIRRALESDSLPEALKSSLREHLQALEAQVPPVDTAVVPSPILPGTPQPGSAPEEVASPGPPSQPVVLPGSPAHRPAPSVSELAGTARAPKSEAGKPERGKSEAGKTEVGKTEVGKTEAIPVDSGPINLKRVEESIRLARAERTRGNKQAALDKLLALVEEIPRSAVAWEALGDEYVERKRTKEAREAYQRAHELLPEHSGIERKYAALVFTHVVQDDATFEQLMRGDTLLMSPGESLANAKLATVFSIFLPGSGQLVMGQNRLGIGLLVTWLLMVGWAVSMQADLRGLLGMAGITSPGGPRRPDNLTVLVPIFAAIAIHFASVSLCAAASSRAQQRTRAKHPAPPVDKEF